MPVSYRAVSISNMNRVLTLLALPMVLLFLGCKQKRPLVKKQHCVKYASLPVKYAKGFSVDYYYGFRVITISNPQVPNRVIATYVLKNNKKPLPLDFASAKQINYPAQKTVCFSTTHIAFMDELGLTDSIIGVTNSRFVYNTKVHQNIKRGLTYDVGADNSPDYEKIISLKPDVIMTYGDAEGNDASDTKLNRMGGAVVINFDYMEQHPLARAEWIKFIGVLYNMEDVADSIFNDIETKYNAVKDSVTNIRASKQPRVVCNSPFKGIWYMPCGENYTCKLIADAGGDFIWKDANNSNGLNLSLDYESVFEKAHNADYWLLNSTSSSIRELVEMDSRNKSFLAIQVKSVFNYDKRKTASGGLDFWESGVCHPERILRDLATIFYPQHFTYPLFYYQQVK